MDDRSMFNLAKLNPSVMAFLIAACVAGKVAMASSVVSEIRLGGFDHSFDNKEHGFDLGGEVLFVSPFFPDWRQDTSALAYELLHPQPSVGFIVSTSGQADQLYAGVNWRFRLASALIFPRDALVLNAEFGPALNNGHVNPVTRQDRSAVGSNLLFHVQGVLEYLPNPRWAIGGYFGHSSNAGLRSYNESLNDLGVTVAYLF